MKKLLSILFILTLTQSAYSAIELDFNFGYDKSVFGENRQNKSTERSYGGSVAFYFLSMTAIEFNYEEAEKETVINYDTTDITSGFVIEDESSNLLTKTYGVGIRQALAGKNAFIQPMISVGWARQAFESSSTATLVDKDTSARGTYKSKVSTFEYDSVFGAFALKFKLTKTFSIKGSVKTAFKAFKWDQARDQLSYSAGLTWLF